MKKLVLATLIAAFAAGLQTFAAVSSLPIGSVEKVLNHELANTHEIWVNVQATDDNWKSFTFLFMGSWRSYNKADGSEESVNALCQRASLSSDKTELKTLLERMLREAVRVSVNPNDPSLQGKVIEASADGLWKPDATNFTQAVGTFAVGNDFVLEADTNGNMVIPETAYETDMNKAITAIRINQGFWIDGVVKAEIRDAQGNVLERDTTASWITTANVIGISNAYVFGQQPGVIQLWYLDGSTQTFSLDGSLISSPTLTIAPVVPSVGLESAKISQTQTGVIVRFMGPLGVVNLEYADSFGGQWLPLATLTNTTGSVEFVDVATNSARFYRAHLNVGGN